MNDNRVKYNSKEPQTVRTMGGDQTFIRDGNCVLCGARVFSEVAEDGERFDPDPRGAVDMYHARKTLVASEYGMSGDDVVACWNCYSERGAEHYNRLIGLAKFQWVQIEGVKP